MSVPNGLVAANKIVGASGFGIHILVGHSSVTNNTVVDCGSGSVGTGGIRVVAISGSLTNNTVTGAAGDGYAIQGNSIYLIDMRRPAAPTTASTSARGTATRSTAALATGCAAEGLDNSAGVTGTSVKNCVFSKCRIDFAGNGTLAHRHQQYLQDGRARHAPCD